jgi:hypothetical protein
LGEVATVADGCCGGVTFGGGAEVQATAARTVRTA